MMPVRARSGTMRAIIGIATRSTWITTRLMTASSARLMRR